MRRRAVVALGGSVLASGCVDLVGSGGDGPPIAERFDCEATERPDPDVEPGVRFDVEVDGDAISYTAVGRAEYPQPPESLRDGTIKQFVETYEIAYRRNDLVDRYGRDLVTYDTNVDATTILDRRDGSVLARLDMLEEVEILEDDGVLSIGHGPVAGAYAVDETWALRTDVRHRDAGSGGADGEGTPAPLRDGMLVACF